MTFASLSCRAWSTRLGPLPKKSCPCWGGRSQVAKKRNHSVGSSPCLELSCPSLRQREPNSSLSQGVSCATSWCRPRLLRDRRCTTAGILTCRNLIEGMPTTAPGLDKPSTLQQVQAGTSHVTCFNQDSTSLCTCRAYVGKGAPATAPSCEVCGEQSATVGNLATRQCMLRPISKDDQAQIANKFLSGRKPGQTEGDGRQTRAACWVCMEPAPQTTQRHRTTR